MIDRRRALGLLALAAVNPWPASAAGLHPTITLWSVLERARQDVSSAVSDENPDDLFVDAVTARLTAGGRAQVLAFAAGFAEAMGRANRWDLWGAGYVIHGGLSDDGFFYFRAWLIGQGRSVFEQALADPDSLAELIPADREMGLELESLTYAAMEAWENINDRSETAQDFPEPPAAGDPTGEPFDEETLAQAYPRLAARFGETPLL